ncbi:neuronal acetylcholine receptor subunit beta-3-like [Trichogramma pretiosum]|uniref:neuronal acetylcholine receptor subunit beta-3-like n=1 Tax=Trichogramma pretiosum TaxID=7493 RepID=UPI0006C94436|nr:neuronal acetylcholine receptor subunit beta-3-like [Trichogramma pretiosum]
MRRLPMLIVSFVVCASVVAEDSSEKTCNILSDKWPSLQLKRHLFCEYDKAVRPVANKSASISIQVELRPKFMEFYSSKSQFILHTWVELVWRDEHLNWNPEEFEGVEWIQLKSEELWLPDLSLYNSGDLSVRQTGIPPTICTLWHMGQVECSPSIKYTSQCETDYTFWPYDLQNCTITMGSWMYSGELVDFDFGYTPISMKGFVANKWWAVTNYTTARESPQFGTNNTYPQLSVSFRLQRHSDVLRAVYVTPLIVLAALTLALFWLDSRSTERLMLASITFICHLLCIYSLHWLMPSNGLKLPHVLLFYRDSMIITSFAIVLTTLLRKLQSTRGIPAPIWIESSVSFVANNPAGRWLLLEDWPPGNSKVIGSDDREPIDAMPMKIDNWRRLALIIDWLALFASTFTYLLLFISRIPKSEYEKSLTSL